MMRPTSVWVEGEIVPLSDAAGFLAESTSRFRCGRADKCWMGQRDLVSSHVVLSGSRLSADCSEVLSDSLRWLVTADVAYGAASKRCERKVWEQEGRLWGGAGWEQLAGGGPVEKMRKCKAKGLAEGMKAEP